MSGECKSYKLNSPMTWADYLEMPDDIRVLYIQSLRNKYNVPFELIGKMLGVSQKTMSRETIRLGLSSGHKGGQKGTKKVWDRDGWLAWVNGVPAPTASPDPEPLDLVQPVPVFTIPLKEKSTLDRALGMLLGLSYGATPDISRGILDAIELIECALGEGECE